MGKSKVEFELRFPIGHANFVTFSCLSEFTIVVKLATDQAKQTQF